MFKLIYKNIILYINNIYKKHLYKMISKALTRYTKYAIQIEK